MAALLYAALPTLTPAQQAAELAAVGALVDPVNPSDPVVVQIGGP